MIGEVLVAHVRDGILDPATLRVDRDAYAPIGRLFGGGYVRTHDRFEMPRLTYREWLARKARQRRAMSLDRAGCGSPSARWRLSCSPALTVWGFVFTERFLPAFELSVADVERTIESWGAWGVAGSILLMVLHSLVPFPAEIVAMANGMLYGPLWGTLITWTGAMLGAHLAFRLARWLGRPFVLAAGWSGGSSPATVARTDQGDAHGSMTRRRRGIVMPEV